jgi:hypothetical protein
MSHPLSGLRPALASRRPRLPGRIALGVAACSNCCVAQAAEQALQTRHSGILLIFRSTESQFESYRSLGFEIMEDLLYRGTESAGVRSYAMANLDFPHQSTANQWFMVDGLSLLAQDLIRRQRPRRCRLLAPQPSVQRFQKRIHTYHPSPTAPQG